MKLTNGNKVQINKKGIEPSLLINRIKFEQICLFELLVFCNC